MTYGGFTLEKAEKKNNMKHNTNFTVTAHTGCMSTKMNSLESIKKADEYGADITEFDLNFTSDLSPVLSHNSPLGGEVRLEEAFELLSLCPRLKINIDIKSDKNLGVILPLAKKYSLESRIFLTGVNLKFVDSVRRDADGIDYYLNYFPNRFMLFSKKYINSVVRTVKQSGAIGLNANFRFVSKRLATACQKNGLLVSLWTANTPEQMKKSISMNPDNITTKDIKTLITLKTNY